MTANKRVGDIAVKEAEFLCVIKLSGYESRLGCYNFRIINVIPIVKTQKIAIAYIQRNI